MYLGLESMLQLHTKALNIKTDGIKIGCFFKAFQIHVLIYILWKYIIQASVLPMVSRHLNDTYITTLMWKLSSSKPSYSIDKLVHDCMA